MTTPSVDYRLIPLSRGKFAKVDADTFDWLMQWKWHVVREECIHGFYAEAWDYSDGKYRIKMHRLIMGCARRDKRQIDHINGDSLDNRRSNLREVNHSQNQMNRTLKSDTLSGHRGVNWCNQTKKWKVRVVANGIVLWRGRFADKDEAIRVAKATFEEAYGQYARMT